MLREEAATQVDRALRGHYQSHFERDVFTQQHRDRLSALSAAHAALVFGRLDLQPGAVSGDQPLYIGRLGLRDAAAEPLLLDWRAPAAAQFYRATAATPGEVRRRRTIRTRGREVVGLSDEVLDPDGADDLGPVCGDGALMAALTAERGARMSDIVATIQAAQDEVIRTDSKRSVLLTGGPGTGKSVVALHRAAFLMYERADYLLRSGVLVVGPSERFGDYISMVLPGLGETSVAVRSLHTLTGVDRAVRHDDPAVGAVKGSSGMAKVIAHVVTDTYPRPDEPFRWTVEGVRCVLAPQALVDARRRVLHEAGQDYNRAHARLTNVVAGLLWQQATGSRGRREELSDLVSELREEPAWLDLLGYSLLPVRDPAAVLARMRSDSAALVRAARGVIRTSEAELLARSLAGTDDLTVGDLPLLDEIRWRLGDPPARASDELAGPSDYQELSTYQDRLDAQRSHTASADRDTGFGHIVVDEAQDLTWMQWRSLRRRGETATWTVVGDWDQATLTDAESSRAALSSLTTRTWASFTLDVNYRTPARIAEVAYRLCGLTSRGTFAREGEPPVCFPDQAAALAWLGEQRGSRALVVPPGESCPAPEGVTVLDAIETKGLEYDAVLVLSPEAYDPADGRQRSMLLIAATRATQRLAFASTDPAWVERFEAAVSSPS